MDTQQKRALSATELVGLFLVVLGVIAGAASGGTPIPLMLIGFVVFAIGWMLRRN